MWKDYRNNSVIYYHVECFREIAGDAYTTEISACTPIPDNDEQK
jgi:hypothetical protein